MGFYLTVKLVHQLQSQGQELLTILEEAFIGQKDGVNLRLLGRKLL